MKSCEAHRQWYYWLTSRGANDSLSKWRKQVDLNRGKTRMAMAWLVSLAFDWSREWSNFRRPMTEQEKRSNSGFLTTLYDQKQEERFEFPFRKLLRPSLPNHYTLLSLLAERICCQLWSAVWKVMTPMFERWFVTAFLDLYCLEEGIDFRGLVWKQVLGQGLENWVAHIYQEFWGIILALGVHANGCLSWSRLCKNVTVLQLSLGECSYSSIFFFWISLRINGHLCYQM